MKNMLILAIFAVNVSVKGRVKLQNEKK